jgi:hypothetical protein
MRLHAYCAFRFTFFVVVVACHPNGAPGVRVFDCRSLRLNDNFFVGGFPTAVSGLSRLTYVTPIVPRMLCLCMRAMNPHAVQETNSLNLPCSTKPCRAPHSR